MTAKFAQLWEGHTSSSRGTAPPSSESEEHSTDFGQKKLLKYLLIGSLSKGKTNSLHIIRAITSRVILKSVINILYTTKLQIFENHHFNG